MRSDSASLDATSVEFRTNTCGASVPGDDCCPHAPWNRKHMPKMKIRGGEKDRGRRGDTRGALLPLFPPPCPPFPLVRIRFITLKSYNGVVNFNYPIFLDLTGRMAVIVGGGSVAARKARGLIDAGCINIHAVALEFTGNLPPEVRRITEPYDAKHLDGASIVFAATNSSAVNESVVRDAEARNLLVCRVDNDEMMPGNFINPAVHRDRSLILAISASGSPALAAEVRDAISEQLSPIYAAMADEMRSLRPFICKHVLDIRQRRVIFRDLASPEALAALATDGPDALRRWLTARYPALQ
ncbi:MAG TPA: bifunctional precorrin-2 dehydrogenase/sirohydrochlorin ferrochelatase [Tepidisphaeraceae bacterium]|nr:bifunctional precorrin-2 dehydrogenase/sirohydrochlorin ferrochelatase [Tepidisphaeraceae bacterium]